ncbi:MAG: hypothetical protein HQL24_02225 [Candidatus Omnitrophica bacterium]|nr:hypothetical protein [Candidatus Omnitrophota bacterium]
MLRNLKELKENEKGVVFILVVSVIIVMMILVISIISINTSQVTSVESEVKRIQAETLAMGALDYSYSVLATNNAILYSGGNPLTETIDGTTFSINTAFDNKISENLTINVDY